MNVVESLNLNTELPNTEFQFKQYGKKCDTVVIGFHGWTGDEHSLIPVSIGVMLHNSLWIFPRAPFNARKISKGYSWFDRKPKSKMEVLKTVHIIMKIVDLIHERMDKNVKIFLLGFSQGATLSTAAGLIIRDKINGIISIAGFLSKKNVEMLNIEPIRFNLPILILHGNKDQVVPVESGIESMKICKELGCDVVMKTYDENHKIPVTAMKLIREFMAK
jgi:phospholipase/carboxylesterase